MRAYAGFKLSRILLPFAVVVASFAARGETARSQYEFSDSKTNIPAEVTVVVAVGESDAKNALAQNFPALAESDAVVIQSELSEHATQRLIYEAQGSTAEPAIAPDDKITRREKFSALGLVLLNTSISTFSFVYFAEQPQITPAVMWFGTSLAMGAYFVPYKKRWPTLQRWGRDKLGKIADRLGLSQWRLQNKKWYEIGAKSLTGFVGNILTGSVFIGIRHFGVTPELSAILGTFGRSANIYLIAQPIDTLLDNWLEKKDSRFKDSTIRFLQSTKGIGMSLMIPIVYHAHLTSEMIAGVGLTAATITWSGLIIDTYRRKSSVDCEAKLASKSETSTGS